MSGAQRGRGVADVLADVSDAADACRIAQGEADAALARRADSFAAAISAGASLRRVAAAAGLAAGTVQRIVARDAGSVAS